MGNKGQGLIELVFAIGVIGLVITGVVSLMVTSLRSRTADFDRKKASELGQKVMEGLIVTKNTKSEDFWNIDSVYWETNLNTNQTMPDYPNYYYVVGFIKNSNDGDASICDDGGFNCADATVGVGWSGARTGEELKFTRFFTRY